MTLMTKSVCDSNEESSMVSLNELKAQVHNLSNNKIVNLLLSLMNEFIL